MLNEQYKMEFPGMGENFNETDVVDLINKIKDSIDNYGSKVFSEYVKDLTEKISILIKIKNGESDLKFNEFKKVVLDKLKEVEDEYKKQVHLDEMYKDDHLDQYRNYSK